MNFVDKVVKGMKRRGVNVFKMPDDGSLVHLIVLNKSMNVMGYFCKKHGHITKKERETLKQSGLSIRHISESTGREIIVRKLVEGY